MAGVVSHGTVAQDPRSGGPCLPADRRVPLLGRATGPDSAVIDHIRPHRGDPAPF
ncbi:hypothetical protein [Rhodovulum sulfidophilum]|uniref:hypothetical protein n=1 Tax=Rhodovulum sulfidophilum TaxID=35806 RepID=UPI001923096D|nr:hypothetical protein [Rhodovulum sulfidophilum]MBL3559609.1 hypothetical protein [Rhodovulum sulfidophilum]